MAKVIVTLTFIAVASLFVYWRFIQLTPTQTIDINIKDKTYKVEIAATTAQKSQGLMNRDSLCQNCGMVFLSSHETPQIFWMKNTLIPLDIIFLNKDGRVINIEQAVPEPGVNDLKLSLYRSQSPSKYVIELNSGDAKKINLIPGDHIDISKL